ncbi:MAG: hypothetical protein UHK54_00575, partial [Acutalibacteraceae bacterium]|nr:hypothetical protein [Acutalibacteraceae bacterium]
MTNSAALTANSNELSAQSVSTFCGSAETMQGNKLRRTKSVNTKDTKLFIYLFVIEILTFIKCILVAKSTFIVFIIIFPF